MPTYKKGDRVIATDDIGGALLPTVPKGTEGVVTHVGWFGLTVAFNNGRTEDCAQRHIAMIGQTTRGTWW